LPQTTIFDLLEENGISWKVYQPEPANNALGHFRIYSRFIGTKIVPIEQYYEDLKNGTLPQVAYIHSHAAGLDEHPGGDMPNRPADPTSDDFRERCTWQPPILDPAKDNNDPTKYDVTKWQSGDKPRLNCGIHIQYGARYSSEIINALMNSSAWKDSVFVWTFDESGGIYDHVPPQRAVPPDDIAPRFATDPPDTPGGFHITGGRIPIMVISPFTKKHYVSNTVMDTTAVLKLIQERFGLPSLTKRDAAQASMQEFFDFENPPWLTPPTPPEQPITLPCDRARLP
ncbi:MAG: alkaline phosphatase family protein, partial [Candidatus Korobacteraceae bacterium]